MSAKSGDRPYLHLKRGIDVIVTLLILAIASPVLLLVAIIIPLDSKGPVFYRQLRMGRDERLFEILKFRTMRVNSDQQLHQTFPGDTSVTRPGHLLRRLKIDEIPQLFNVLKGDMSLIGPRPCLPDLIEKMDETARQRFTIRPGLTGLAQVNGNIYIDWEARWQYDVQYVQKVSLWLDIQILFKTVFVVLLGEQRFSKS